MKQKFYKILSIVLTAALVFSCFTIAFNVSADTTATYYVAVGGTGDGSSENTPAGTVKDAVQTAVNAGHTNADTVTVYVTGTVTLGTLPQYPFNLHIIGVDTDGVKATINAPYGNITKATNKLVTTHYSNLNLSGYKVDDGTTKEFRIYGGNLIIDSDVTVNTSNRLPLYSYDGNNGGKIEGQNVEINTALANGLSLGNTAYQQLTYTKDVNVTIGGSFKNTIYFSGNQTTSGGYLKFEKNLNFNIKQTGGAITFNKGSNTITIDGALQVIDSADNVTITSETAGLKDLTAAGGKWFITNNTDIPDLLEFTETAGKYKVNPVEDAEILVDGALIAVVDGCITIPQGSHTITLRRIPKTKIVYVAEGGTGDGSNADSPVATIAEAVALGEGLFSGDTLVVKVAMGKVELGTLPQYSFNLHIIGSNEGFKKSSINAGNNKIANGGQLSTTRYSNIGLTGETHDSFYLNSNNVILDDSVTWLYLSTLLLGTYNDGGVEKNIPGQNIEIKSAAPTYGLYLGNKQWQKRTYTDDVNITIDGPFDAPITFAAGTNEWEYIKFSKNLNFNIKEVMDNIPFEGTDKATVTGALQVIDSSDNIEITENTAGLSTLTAGTKWFITNASGDKDLLSFTATAGKYKVNADTEVYDILVNGESVIVDSDNCITIENAGSYTVTTLKKTAKSKIYFVKSGSTGGDGTNALPFGTVEEAIATAKAQGLTSKIDNVTVNIVDNTALGELPEYKFALNIQSATDKVTLSVGANAIANGNTVYRHIVLDGETLNLNSKQVTIESSVDVNATTINAANNAVINAKLTNTQINANDSIDLVINNANTTATVNFDSAGYKEYVKINVKSANTVTFSGNLTATGTVEIITDSSAAISGIDYAAITAGGGKWYINNQSGEAEGINFTETVGTYSYINGKEVELVGEKTYQPSKSKLTVPEGEYTFNIKTQAAAEYSEYITNYAQGLQNTYSKLNNGEDVKILYFGGSVTNGSGSTNGGSWRERVGKWFDNTFPNAKITNKNVAYGGTTTWFGFQRLQEEVLSQEPDLVFIEFAINDYYSNFKKETAARQFETIVRRIRTELPECDIVTVLTTNITHIDNLINNDELHIQAQAHQEIAREYNIPTIRVGHALADHLAKEVEGTQETWNDIWSQYVGDDVHPTNAGYEVYYNTIKEYLASVLVYGSYDGSVTEHILPQVVSEYLLDGDCTFIDIDETTLAASENFGGTGFTYKPNDANNYKYRGRLRGKVYTTAANSKYIVKFTGTDLTVLYNNSYLQNVRVSVDGDAAVDLAVKEAPMVLVSAAEYGEHTVEITPIFQSGQSSVSFGIFGFFVRDARQSTHTHSFINNEADEKCNICGEPNQAEVKNNYYVEEGKTGVGTKADPAATVKEAVQTAIDSGLYDADDTVTVNVTGSVSMASSGNLDTYPFNLHIVGVDTDGVKATINAPWRKLTNATDKSLTTRYSNVKITALNGTQDTNVRFNGGNIIIDEDVTWGTSAKLPLGAYGDGDDAKAREIDGQNVVINSAGSGGLSLGNIGWQQRTYTDDVNVTIGGSFKGNIYFSAGSNSNEYIRFNKNLNFNIKQAGGAITFTKGSNEVTLNGALQVIDSANNIEITESTAGLSALTATGGKWFITNNTGIPDLLEFTETAGKYKVKSDVKFSINGEAPNIDAEGFITLAQGSYLITPPQYREVYVDSTVEASGDGTKAETAVKTLEEAYNLISDGDATINIIGEYQISLSDTVLEYVFPYHNGKVTLKGVGTDAAIFFNSSSTTNNVRARFLGSSEVDNLTFKYNHPSSKSLQIFTGPDFTFNENSKTACSASGSSHTRLDCGNAFYIHGIYLKDSTDKNSATGDTAVLTLNGGTWHNLSNNTPNTMVNTLTINVGGNAIIGTQASTGSQLIPASWGSVTTADVTLNITGGFVKKLWLLGSSGSKIAGGNTINITGGTVDTIVDSGASGTGSRITGDVNVTIGGTAIVKNINLSNVGATFGGKKNLIFAKDTKKRQYLEKGLGNWDTVTVGENTVVYLTSDYDAANNAPTALTMQENSILYLNSETNTDIPTYTANGNPAGKVELKTITHIHDGSNWSGAFYAQTTGNGSQGMASYGGYYFWANTHGEVNVYNVADTGSGVTPIDTFRFDSYNNGTFDNNFNTAGTEKGWWANHSNQMMFGTEKFDESDEFPLLYVTTGSSVAHDGSGAYIAKCAVERIIRNGNDFTSETVQIIEFNDFANIPEEDGNPYKNQDLEKSDAANNFLTNMYNKETGRFDYISGNGYDASKGYEKIGCGWPAWLVDVEPTKDTAGKIYMYSTRFTSAVGYEEYLCDAYGLTDKDNFSKYNAHIITEFDLPELPTSEDDPLYGKTVTLYPKDITDQFNTEYKTVINQGGVLYNGKLYWTYGGDVNSSRVQIFNIGTKSLNALYNISSICSGEPESCFINNGVLYVGRYNTSNKQVFKLNVLMEEIAATDANCSNPGTIAHAECNLCDEYFSLEDYASVYSSIEDTTKPIDSNTHLYDDECDSYCNDCDIFRQVSFSSYTDKFTISSDIFDWNLSGSYVKGKKLNLVGEVINNYIGSTNQYISVDVRGGELTNGFKIKARVDGSDYYSFEVLRDSIKLTKSGTALESNNSFVFDSTKLYRVSLSVVGDALTANIHDYTDNSTLLNITYIDSDALTGTHFGFCSEDGGITLDNVYFSATGFRKNDTGWVINDVNGDGEFDIRDLVYADEQKGTTEDDVKARADKDNSAVVDDVDVGWIRKYILEFISE